MLYIMSLDDHNVYLDTYKYSGLARYLNHSCAPNYILSCLKFCGICCAYLFAL